MTDPAQYSINIDADLFHHRDAIDAIVVGGDPHATALGAIAASLLGKPLMIVCTNNHECSLSHITTIGDIDPRMRFLYIDDFFSFGSTLRKVFEYMNQSRPANIVATYEAVTRQWDDNPETVAPQYPPF